MWLTGDNGRKAEISFQQRGSLDAEPWALLDRDCQHGAGPEIVTIGRPHTVRCAIYNYSCESALCGSGALLEVSRGSLREELRCPNIGDGLWWLAFDYDCNSEILLVRDRLADNLTLQRGDAPC